MNIEQWKERLSNYKWKGEGVKWKTNGLFLETAQNEKEALFSLQTWDKTKNGILYPSLHNLYVDMNDVAEFEFANTFTASYQHWLELKAKSFFKPYYASMVEELNAKMRSMSLNTMLSQVEGGTASQATLKYLADNDYIPKNKVGKPKREKAPKKEGNVIDADFSRITGSSSLD